MRIGFILPYFSEKPIGGYKVVYEYASRLSGRGHQVTVIHPWHLKKLNGLELVKAAIRAYQAGNKSRHQFWFQHLDEVTMAFVPVPSARWIPDLDAIIATGWRTASWVSALPPRKGQKYYLIQHYETWDGEASAVDATWTLSLHKIVIARWLYQLGVEKFSQGEFMTYIPNGIDLNALRLENPIADRVPYRVGMLYHENLWKGTEDGIAALEEVKRRIPELEVMLFGTSPRADAIPAWMSYMRLPSPEDLLTFYNEIAIFVHPSWAEGWPLPPAEAMACGAALAAAANQGVQDYAEGDVTALLSPPRDPQALANNIVRLIDDQKLRQRIANTGYARIRQYTWETAVSRLETLLEAKM